MGLSTVDAMKHIDLEKNGLKVLSEEELQSLKCVLFYMLKDINNFCKKHKIRYSLAGGTALGAIRHGGFIPWDDDIDLLMPRKDYNRFLSLFMKEMSEEYWIHDPEKTKGYGLGMTRVRKKGTICRSREDKNNEECGVYLDIFVVENTFNSKIFRSLHGLLSYAVGFAWSCRFFLSNRDIYLGFVDDDKKLKKVFYTKIFFGFLFSFLSVDRWTILWNKINSLCKNTKSTYVVVPTGRKHFFGEIYERSWACNMKWIDFTFGEETIKVQVMQGVEKYLEKLYGDYKTIPKKSEIEKHIVLEFEI